MVQSAGSEGGVIVTGGEEGKATVFSNHRRPGPIPITLEAATQLMRRYLEDQGCRGFDDDFDGWVALYFRSIKRVSKKGQTLDLVPNNKPSMAWRSPVIGSG